MKSINLQKQFTFDGKVYHIANWREKGDMAGFVGDVTEPLPIGNYATSSDIEVAIFRDTNLGADVFEDGTATVTVKIGSPSI